MIWATMDVLLCTASIWHMCTMSLDRYCTLRYPISYGRNRTAASVGLKIAFVWVVSTAVSAALGAAGFADYSNVYVDGQCVPAVKEFILYGSILAFYVPLVIMVATYVLTVRILAENRRTMASIGLHATAGGAVKDGFSGGDSNSQSCCKCDGLEASATDSASLRRQPDRPTTTWRYRRMKATESREASQAARLLQRRNVVVVDEQLSVTPTTLRRGDRHLTDTDAISTSHDAGANRPSVSDQPPWNVIHCPTPRKPSTANLSVSPPSNYQLDVNMDGTPQPFLAATSNPKTRSPQCDGSERQRRKFAYRQCLTPTLQSNRLDVSAAGCLGVQQTASTNSPTVPGVENVVDRRRRMSDGALERYGVVWEDRHQRRNAAEVKKRDRRQQGPSCVDLRGTLLSTGRRSPFGRVRDSSCNFVTDASSCCSDRATNCNRRNRVLSPSEVSDDDESTFNAGTNRFRQQRQGRRLKPERGDCQRRPAVEYGTCQRSTAKDGDQSAGCSRSTRCAAHTDADRPKNLCDASRRQQDDVEATDGAKVVVQQQQRPAATDISLSMSMSSVSQSESVIGQFRLSTFRCGSADHLSKCSATSSYGKHRRNVATKERRASKVLGIIFGVFVLLWTPFFVVNVLSIFCQSCLRALGSAGVSSIVWLGYASSLANPIVYTMFSTSFRTVFYRIVTCQVCRRGASRRSGGQTWTSYPPSRQGEAGHTSGGGNRQRLLQPPPEISGFVSHANTAAP